MLVALHYPKYPQPLQLFAHEGPTRGRPKELLVVKVAKIIWNVDAFHSSCGSNMRAMYLHQVKSV